jgi:hypothetical protein
MNETANDLIAKIEVPYDPEQLKRWVFKRQIPMLLRPLLTRRVGSSMTR